MWRSVWCLPAATCRTSSTGAARWPSRHPLAAYDALKPQRVSGALDDTAWPSILPTQAESWIGEQRVVLRRAGVELFPKFTVTNIEAGGVLEATLDAVSGEATPMWPGHARATGPGPRARRHSHRAR